MDWHSEDSTYVGAAIAAGALVAALAASNFGFAPTVERAPAKTVADAIRVAVAPLPSVAHHRLTLLSSPPPGSALGMTRATTVSTPALIPTVVPSAPPPPLVVTTATPEPPSLLRRIAELLHLKEVKKPKRAQQRYARRPARRGE